MLNLSNQRSRLRLRLGLHRSLPLLLPLFAFGASFGLYARQTHFDGLAAIAMSVLTFAGSAQFAALGVLASGGGVLAVLLAVLLINSRYLSMGLSLAPALPRVTWQRLLLAQLMVDESWLLSRNRKGRHYIEVYCGVGIAEFSVWLLGTLAGLLFADHLPAPETLGLDIGITAFFLALLGGQLDCHQKRFAALSSALLAGVLIPFQLSQWALLLAPLPILFYLSVLAGRRRLTVMS